MYLAPGHKGPGRRLAFGCNKADTLLALFGFVSHAVLFMAIGGILAYCNENLQVYVVFGGLLLALILFVVRGAMVGLSTTKESLLAIKNAWLTKETNDEGKV